MLDEINEQTDQMQQIQDAMAQPIGPAADMDEDELMGELEVWLADLYHQVSTQCTCPKCAGQARERFRKKLHDATEVAVALKRLPVHEVLASCGV